MQVGLISMLLSNVHWLAVLPIENESGLTEFPPRSAAAATS